MMLRCPVSVTASSGMDVFEDFLAVECDENPWNRRTITPWTNSNHIAIRNRVARPRTTRVLRMGGGFYFEVAVTLSHLFCTFCLHVLVSTCKSRAARIFGLLMSSPSFSLLIVSFRFSLSFSSLLCFVFVSSISVAFLVCAFSD